MNAAGDFLAASNCLKICYAAEKSWALFTPVWSCIP